jgi:uncharacterized protein YbbC (DUF1343 family)
VRTGLDRLVAGDTAVDLRGAATGLVLHPASVTADLALAVDALLGAGFRLRALFGPQHGARGEKQDNMIESGHYVDGYTGLPVHSLYSEVRKPTPDMLAGLDAVLFDLQDVGVRVYTFMWTMALSMEACAEAGVRFVVLDRPNPVGGVRVEGPVLRSGFESFVGLHPIPLRHGLTAGELARWLNEERGIGCDLEVVPLEGWRRDMAWSETGLPWVLPSPNLPTPDSCAVYPGMVLVEGTNLSEGRGTTRPFELVGAPWLDGRALADLLEGVGLEGARFRPCSFEPTFQKHAGAMCNGVQIHVTDRTAFEPVRAAVELFRAARALAPDDFDWRPPPYEYEERLMPIDILWGHDGLRLGVDAGRTTEEILAGVQEECAAFREAARPYVLYD